MIKLFRTTRKILLNEGKTRRYFKYAIGEIILVVVGILIALWLNKLNEQNIKRQQELQTLRQLRGEFESNLEQLNEKISMRTSMIEASSRLLYFHDNPDKVQKDSVATLLARTSVAPTFDPITNDLISGGRLYLITNTELKAMLSKWPSDLVQVTEEEIAWIFILRNTYMPFLYQHYSIRDLNAAKWNKLDVVQTLLLDKNNLTTNAIGHSKEVFDVEAFLVNPKLADQLSTVISSCLFAKTQSEFLRKSISKILFLIKKELKSQT